MIMSTTITPLLARILTGGAAILQLACSSPDASQALAGAKVEQAPVRKTHSQHGIASIYTDHRTASGERFSKHALTAAHKSLPLGSKVKVTNLKNDKTVIVRINDRGPYIKGRIIDLTPAAAAQIGLCYKQGLTRVKVEKL